MTRVNKISIIGGTGNLGVPVVKYLLKSGFEINLIVRNIDKARKLFKPDPKLKICVSDLNNVSGMKEALRETEYLYLSLSTQATDINIPFSAEREGMRNILEAVNRDRIKQIIVLSGLGAFDNACNPDGFEFIPNIIRKQGHKLLKNSGIPFTILHCSYFTDSFVIYRQKESYSIIGSTTNPIYFVNCHDFTVHLINSLGNPEAFFREFPVQGYEGLTHPKAARTFFDIYAKQTSVKILPAGIIKALALFNKEMKYVKHMSDYFHHTNETFLAKDYHTYEILGTPSLSISDYAQKLKDEKIYDYLERV